MPATAGGQREVAIIVPEVKGVRETSQKRQCRDRRVLLGEKDCTWREEMEKVEEGWEGRGEGSN